VVVGEQHPSSQGGGEPLESLRIRVVVQRELSSLPPDFHPKDLGDVLTGRKMLRMLRKRRRALSELQGKLKRSQKPTAKGKGYTLKSLQAHLRDAAELSVEQLLAVRDDDGPMTPQNLLGGTEGGQSLQAGILEGLETVEGNVQKILVLGGTQEPTTW